MQKTFLHKICGDEQAAGYYTRSAAVELLVAMEVGEGRSSSNELSSVPNSDVETPPSRRQGTSAAMLSHPPPKPFDSHVLLNYQNVDGAHGISASTTTSAPAGLGGRQDSTTIKIRAPRKKKEAATTDSEKKEKVPRKPRTTTAPSRKKLKVEDANGHIGSVQVRQEVLAPDTAKAASASSTLLQSNILSQTNDEAAKNTQLGMSRQNQEYIARPPPSADARPVTSPQQTSTRSSVIFDPVRSLNAERPPDTPRPSSSSQVAHTPPRPVFPYSASSTLSSILDPPHFGSTELNRQPRDDLAQEHLPQHTTPQIGAFAAPTESANGTKAAAMNKTPSEGPSNAPSPKPARAKEVPPPAPQGTGLLSSVLFGGESKADGSSKEEKAPSIVVHFDLKGKSNQVISFARMAEEKYGFAALYPRQAAQRERLAKVAAIGAALEASATSSKRGGSGGESGDDRLSVDIDRDSDNDSDVAMGGLNGIDTAANSGTDAAPKQRKPRTKKMEEYDQDDPFVDDSEMLWEAQAAASKDGFFVYSGPLVPEGEKPTVERFVLLFFTSDPRLTIFAEQMVPSSVDAVEVEVAGLALAEDEVVHQLLRILKEVQVLGEEVVLALEVAPRLADRESPRARGRCVRRRS